MDLCSIYPISFVLHKVCKRGCCTRNGGCGPCIEGIKQGCLLLALLILAFLSPRTSKQRCNTGFVLYKSTYGTYVRMYVRNVTYARMFTFCHRSSPYIYYRILIHKLHTNVGYDNISSKFDFQGPSLKVKVTVAIFRKQKNFVISLVPIFINGFSYNCTQRLSIIISKAGLTIRVHRSRSRSLWLFLEKKKKKKKKKKTNKHCYGSNANIYW